MSAAHEPGWETFVVDASAVVEIVLGTSALGSAAAERMRGGHVVAPALLPFEVANVIRRHVRAGIVSSEDGLRAHGRLRTMPADLWPHEALAARAWQLGANLSIYDATYVALAEQVGAVLITADARIARAPGVRCAVEVVDDDYPAYVKGLRTASG